MNCLWLSGDVPYPQLSGRRIYSAQLADALGAAGADVVALGIATDEVADEAAHAEWRAVADGASPGPLRKVRSRWPSSAEDRHTAEYRAAIAAALDAGGWDVAVIDHLQMCWALPLLRRAGVPVAYVSHNHEASVRDGIADHASWRDPRKAALHLDARRARRSERMLATDCALVTTVTEADAARFRADGARNVVVIAPGYTGTVRPDRTIDETTPRVAMIVTSLLWHVKRTNTLRFAAAADPLLAQAGIELRIVGATPDGFGEHSFGGLRATRFVGRVERVDDQLAEARVGVISEPEGGGFKLKALDYVFHRVPMAVLDGSMEGLPLAAGAEYVGAATEEELARRLVELVDDPAECQRLQARAFDRCADRFDWSTRGTDLVAALAEIASTKGVGR